MKYSFFLAGTTKLPPPVPVSSKNILRATPVEPFGIVMVSVPPVTAWVW